MFKELNYDRRKSKNTDDYNRMTKKIISRKTGQNYDQKEQYRKTNTEN